MTYNRRVTNHRPLLLLLCVLAAPLWSAPADIPEAFRYDATRPLGERLVSSELRGSVRIDTIEYASPAGGPVPALLVRPATGDRRNAGILFGHWGLGEKRAFLEEAVDLAARGAVSLLIDSSTIRPEPWGKRDDAEYDQAIVQNVIDARRGVDLLVARADVDPRRLAYVGLSMGAHLGGIMAGVERRFSAFVLMGGTARLSDVLRAGEYRRGMNAEQSRRFDAWLDRMARLDARHYVRNAAPARVFLQFTTADEYVPLSEAQAFFAATSEPKLMKWYDGGHELGERARRDRAEWLRTVIGIDDDSPAHDERIAFPERGAAAGGDVPDPAKLSVVMDVPGMQHVEVRRDVTYKQTAQRALKFDVYYPFARAPGQKVPAVILVAGQAHPAYMRDMRMHRSLTSAARLVAANTGRAAIVYDVRSAASGAALNQRFTSFDEVQKDLTELIDYVRAHADELQLDGDALALWARSAGTTYGTATAFSPASRVKAYVAYYPELNPAVLLAAGVSQQTASLSTILSALESASPALPPTLIVTTSEADVASLERLDRAQQRGTIKHRHIGNSQHAFEIFDDTEASRAALRETLKFFRDQLPLRNARSTQSRELTFVDAAGVTRPATLILPANGAARGGVLFLHWLGGPPKNDRTEFLDDAHALAADGIASLLVDMPWAERGWFRNRDLARDEEMSREVIRSVSKAVDELARTLPRNAPMAMVGHDFGAMYGLHVAADDRRIGAAVLIAATPRFADWMLLGRKLDETATRAYVQNIEQFDAAHPLTRRTDLPLLFQFSRKDEYVTEARANEFFESARGPKQIRWYDSTHRMDDPAAAKDRQEWLRRWFE